jgi:hypothetical protein
LTKDNALYRITAYAKPWWREKERLRALKKLLAQLAGPDLKMKDVGIQLVRNYEQKRIAEGVGPRTVNMEGQLLRSILKHHEQWKLDGKYEPLREQLSETGRSLTPEEEVRLLDPASLFTIGRKDGGTSIQQDPDPNGLSSTTRRL